MARLQSSNDTSQSPTPRPLARSRTSSLRRYVSKRRWWLGIGAIIVIAAMIIGIVFAAHQYYVSFGGQGFLKVRMVQNDVTPIQGQRLFLPMRRMEFWSQDSTLMERSPGNVPYYTCGDQQHNCEAYDQPNICCPVLTYCHPTKFTNSGIFCCNSTIASECHSSRPYPPKCLDNTFECSEETSGGCCPHGTICAPNGCIKITGPSLVNDSSSPEVKSGSSVVTTTIQDGNAAEGAGITTVSVTTVTERPAATTTGVKQGEVAENGVTQQGSVFVTLCLPYFSAWLLVCMAALMGYL